MFFYTAFIFHTTNLWNKDLHINHNFLLTSGTYNVIFTYEEGSGEMDIDFKIIGKRIRSAREKKSLSQERLSEKLDVTVAFLSRVERGKSEVNLKRLSQIANVLDVPLEELITGTSPQNSNYLDKDLYEILIKCTPEKQKLIYNIAKIVSGVKFV